MHLLVVHVQSRIVCILYYASLMVMMQTRNAIGSAGEKHPFLLRLSGLRFTFFRGGTWSAQSFLERKTDGRIRHHHSVSVACNYAYIC